MIVSKAVEGYFYDKGATYSRHTLEAYKFVFATFIGFVGETRQLEDITPDDLQRFILWLKDDYQPHRWNKADTSPLSPAGVDLHWKGLRSLFKWAHETLDLPRPDLNMPRPKFERAHVKPFTEEEIRRLVHVCEYTTSKTHGKDGRPFRQRRPTSRRDKALILVLLDTGLRLGELLRLTLQDVNLEDGEILVAPYGTGRKTKTRSVILGATARRALWTYVAKAHIEPDDHIFPMSMDAVRQVLKRLGERAEVADVHPHRFRHSFAIWFLRGGGDIFTLQRILGHRSLDMVNYYLDIAQSDIATSHRKASAVDRWNSNSPL